MTTDDRLTVLRAGLPAGITVSTWSPGDGRTRYRFHASTQRSGEPADYFSADDVLATVMGAEAAFTVAAAIVASYGIGWRRGHLAAVNGS